MIKIMFAILMISTISVFAQQNPIDITLDQEIYHYGDRLEFTINTNQSLGNTAIITITDSSGKNGTPIKFTLEQNSVTITAPNPFDDIIFKKGTYKIDLEYNGYHDSESFELKESSGIVIPIWIKDVAKFWLEEKIKDVEFTQALKHLVEDGIITLEHSNYEKTDMSIPKWIKTNTSWWIEGKISDGEFAASLEYLINARIISIYHE